MNKYFYPIKQAENINFVRKLMSLYPMSALLKSEDSRYLAVNNVAAKLTGYQHPWNMEGTTDHEIKCQAAKFADTFIEQDQFALANQLHTAIDICTYADSNIHAFSTSKTKIFLQDEQQYAVLCFMHEMDKATLTHLLNLTNLHFDKKTRADASGSYQVTQPKISTHNISQKESEILFFLLRGGTAKDIANRLHISARTVEKHILNLRQKFNCYSRSQLIEKAMNEGYFYQLPENLILKTS